MNKFLVIDAQRQQAFYVSGARRIPFSKQWFELYALLAVRCAARDLLTGPLETSELCTLGKWIALKPESAGKKVARHLASLEDKGLGQLLSWKQRTQGW